MKSLIGMCAGAMLIFGCQPTTVNTDFNREVPGRIINGTPTDYQKWQSALMIELIDSRTGMAVMCSGTLVHPSLVLTAAHCLYMETSTTNYDFRNQSNNINIYGGSYGDDLVGHAEEVVVHPSWYGDIDNKTGDLAFIRLRNPVFDIVPSRVGEHPGPEVGDTAVVVGYGVDTMDTTGSNPLHREGYTTIIDKQNRYFEIGGKTNTCSGDSGGPLFTKQNGEWVLMGVTSFGAMDCSVEDEGFSVNLLAFCGWLNETMMLLVGTDLGLETCTSCDPTVAESWGQPCGPGFPCCPDGTLCRTPEEFSDGSLGFCAPSCCTPGEPDADYCTDVADGAEGCFLKDDGQTAYCAVSCETESDCPRGTACKNRPFESDKICIAEEKGPGPDCGESPEEVDTASDSESELTETVDTSPPPSAPSEKKGGKKDGCAQVAPGRRFDAIVVRALQLVLLTG